MHTRIKTSKVNGLFCGHWLVNIRVPSRRCMVQPEKRMEQGRFAGAVRAENERERANGDERLGHRR